MKEESLARGEKPIEINERPAIDELTLDDLQGTFFLVAFCIIVSVVAFAGEQIKRCCSMGANARRLSI